jgi:Domain of unknown function (DUF5664)
MPYLDALSSLSTQLNNQVDSNLVGQKFDGSKLPVVQGFMQYFPRAIEAVTLVSKYGTTKYNKGRFPTSWKQVPDGFNRYTDALGRHMVEEHKGNTYCHESGLLHAAQVAWNAMARLELLLASEKYIPLQLDLTLKEENQCQKQL